MNSVSIHANTSPRCGSKSENEKHSDDDEEISKYPFVSALSMSGGDGVNSYSTNSLLQRRVLSMTMPILVKNTKEMMTKMDFPKCIEVADLGCSTGQNSFLAMSDIVNTINMLCQEWNQNPPEIDCFLNDLPCNDFNMTFKLITFFKQKLANKESCFVSGVPGSFYSRLFPRKSLHFVLSIYSIHFLSKVLQVVLLLVFSASLLLKKLLTTEFWICKVPNGLEKNNTSVYIAKSSPLSEYKAYLNQFQIDFTTFLRLRSEEMVSNGHMVFAIIGRKTLEDPLYRDCCHFQTLLSISLRDLVNEGLASVSKANSFKMPFYDPNEEEVKEIISKEGSFRINDLETHGFDLGHSNEDPSLQSHRVKAGQREAGCMRAVTETMLVAHFGDEINIDKLFENYAYHVSQHTSCRNKTSVTLVVSLIRK